MKPRSLNSPECNDFAVEATAPSCPPELMVAPSLCPCGRTACDAGSIGGGNGFKMPRRLRLFDRTLVSVSIGVRSPGNGSAAPAGSLAAAAAAAVVDVLPLASVVAATGDGDVVLPPRGWTKLFRLTQDTPTLCTSSSSSLSPRCDVWPRALAEDGDRDAGLYPSFWIPSPPQVL